MLRTGLNYTSKMQVEERYTAQKIGSGDMAVLATPMMMALMENAAMMAVKNELPEGTTTVGGHIEASHVKPSKVGSEIIATAKLTKIDGKKLYFTLVAKQDDIVIGEGTHLRFIVDKEKFLSRL